jgi:hypothetical protein
MEEILREAYSVFDCCSRSTCVSVTNCVCVNTAEGGFGE